MKIPLTCRTGWPGPGGRPGEVAGCAQTANDDLGRRVPIVCEPLPLRTGEGEVGADGNRRVVS